MTSVFRCFHLMRYHIILFAVFFAILLEACGEKKDSGQSGAESGFVSYSDSSSYLLGFIIAREAEKTQILIDPQWLMKGLRDGFAGRGGMLPDSMMFLYRKFLGKKFEEGYFRTVFLKASENLKKSEEFLETNKSAEGVFVLPGDVQYKVIRQGTGAVPGITPKVKVFYKAEPLNGIEFVNSKASGGPEIWEIRGLLTGLQQALASMREGTEWEIWIPPGLAYGEDGLPGKVATNEVLHCYVDLVSLLRDTVKTTISEPLVQPVPVKPVTVQPDSNRPKPAVNARTDSARKPSPVIQRADSARR